MHYLHLFLRYTFATLAGLLLGGFLLTTFTCIAFGFLIIPNILSQLVGLLVLGFGVSLFPEGLKIGFTWGNHFYKNRIQGDSANPLLNKIDCLNTAKPAPLLSLHEIEQLQKFSEHKEKLDKYLNDIDDCCPISQEPFFSDISFVTITGVTLNMQNGRDVEAPFTRTYERKSIREWIRINGKDAKEPAIGCPLNDPKYKIVFHAGLPAWIYKFIQTVRSVLVPSSHATILHHMNEQPKNKLPLSIKTKTALMRQEYYKKKHHENILPTVLQEELDAPKIKI